MEERPDGVYFYGGPFSNFASSPFELDGAYWPTVEHYFQAQKSENRVVRESIRTALSPGVAKQLGNACFLRSNWEDIKFDVMLKALRAKFSQNPIFADVLKATGDKPIFEDSPTDFIWGYRNHGQNLLGKALEIVRAEMFGRG